MKMTKEEKRLLAKLASGALDGLVGDEKVYPGYKKVYCGKYIKDGEPVSYRENVSWDFSKNTAGLWMIRMHANTVRNLSR